MNHRFSLFLSLFASSLLAQPTFNHVYQNGVEPMGAAWAGTLALLENGDLMGFGHLIACPECSFQQRVCSVRFDPDGNDLEWKLYGCEDSLYILYDLRKGSVFRDLSDRFICYMGRKTIGATSIDSYVLRLNEEGAVEDTLIHFSYGQGLLPDSGWLLFNAKHGLQAQGGEYVFCGSRTDTLTELVNAPPKMAFMAVNEEGAILWQKDYENSFQAGNMVTSVGEGYWLSGVRVYFGPNAYGVHNSTKSLIVKTDSVGNEQFRHEFGGYGYEGSTFLHEEPDRLVVAGYQTYDEPYTSTANDDQGYMYIRAYHISDTGLSLFEENVLYEMTGIPGELDRKWRMPYGFKATETSQYFIWGDDLKASSESDLAIRSGFLTKVNQSLEEVWSRRYSHPEYLTSGNWHHIADIQITESGSMYLFGDIKAANGLTRLWLLHVDEYGCLEPGCHLVGTEEIITHMTETMSVYPNPARAGCTVAFALPSSFSPPAHSQLKLVDMQGRIVRVIDLEGHEVAAGQVRIDLSGLVPGVYVGHWMDGGRWMDSVKIVVE